MLVNIQVVDLIIAWFHYRNVVSGNKRNALDYNNSKFIPSHSHNDQYFSSVHFSRSVMSNSLRPHGLQHARLPCPSPAPRAYSNSFPESVMPSNHLILCLPLLLLPSTFPSLRVFSNQYLIRI